MLGSVAPSGTYPDFGGLAAAGDELLVFGGRRLAPRCR
jgi:hypothetical protein